MSRCSVLAAALAALVGTMLAFGVWVGVAHWPVAGAGLVVPIGPGRQIEVELWTHDLAFSTAYSTGGLTRQRPGPLRVRVSYQRPVAGVSKGLAVVRVPTSAPVIVGGSMGLTALWLGVGRLVRTG